MKRNEMQEVVPANKGNLAGPKRFGGHFIRRAACEQLRTVGLSASAQERLARVLLEWSQGAEQTKSGTRITMLLTHEEIGELIGSSRETVTRTFSEFKSRHLVALKGPIVTIPDRTALELVAGT
jgi:CRP/FNR family transcriptional regulator, cyclic AMP receptor protein